MAALLVALFFCVPPQVFLYPAAQRCSVILPVLPGSWSQPFCSFFSCAYLMSFYGRRRAASEAQEDDEGGGLLHKMRAHFLVPHIASRNSGRSSKFSTRDRSWCCRQAPRGSRLMLLFISWSLLLLLLGMPCLVGGASELLRIDGQTGYAENLHRGNKGADILSQLSGINGRRYKHGEPPPGRTNDGLSGKLPDEPELNGPRFSSRLESVTADGLDMIQVPSAGESSGLEASKPTSRNLERLHFGSLIRECLKVKCSPLASFDVKQPLLDGTPPFLSKTGSATFQGPIASAPHVAIIPPFLEWGSQPIFTPSIASLTLVNTCNSTQLKVFQPFSTDVQFYTSGFEEKLVDPGEELSIPIVFLPRVLGVADAMLIVQTSAGGFLVQAQGRGIGSPYKVRPLQGLRVACGETLRHTISLHNPHDEILRVDEVYAWPNKFAEFSVSDSNAAVKGGPTEREVISSSGVSCCVDSQNGEVHHLASEVGDPKGIHGGAAVIQMRPLGQLEIGPHSSNSIAEFEFAALRVDKYSGSLHIKLFREMQGTDDVLILPIEVQVGEAKSDASTVEPVVDVLEFGILTKEDQTSKMDVVLYNPGTEAVQVEDISLLLEDENIVHIEYKKGLVIPPNSETEVAAVTYMGREETVPSGLFECHPRELLRDRMLIVRTNSSLSPKVEVPYRALVFHGSADCDPAQGSVGFGPQRSNSDVGAGLSVVEGGALSEQRVYFVNGLSVPLPLFMDLERRARATNTQLLPSILTSHSGCCHESSGGHLAVSAGQLSIVAHTELLYPLVQIGTEELRWVNVTNPSEKALFVQVLVSSKVEASDLSCQHILMNSEGRGPGCSQGVLSDSPDVKVTGDVSDNLSSVFSFAEGAVVEVVVEPHGTATLGPLVFRPPERCLWTGLLSLWNNLTQVEWVPLQGSGGSASVTFLDGEYPIDLLQLDFNATQVTMISGVMEEQVAGFSDAEEAKPVCSQRVSRAFSAKNTGEIHLDVTAVELVGGGCSAYGFKVDSCYGFSLAPGQSAELVVSFQPDFTAKVFQRDVRLITSAGIIQIPLLANLAEHVLAMCSEVAQSTNLDRAFLLTAIIALVVVLGVFFRMLLQEMSLAQDQVSTNGLKSVPQHKVGGRQMAPVLFPPTHAVVMNKTSNSLVVSGRLKCSSAEPEVQSRTGDGTGASGPGRPKESMKGLVRALKGVADSFTATVGSTSGSEEINADMTPPPGLPGLRVKIPNSAALNAQKSNLGSPMREASSPSSTHFRKGMAEKRSHTSRFDGLQAKIAPESLEENLALKQSPVPQSPKSVICNDSLVFTKQGADVETSQHLYQQSLTPINSGVVSGSPMLQSPRKGSQFNHFKQVLSPKSQPLSPRSQPPLSSTGVNDKDKSKRKKRRSNVGTVKHESVSKGRSGSSSPSSSPASPATPASPSRPVSPLFPSELQSNTSVIVPTGFSSSKDPGGAPLAKLDVVVEHSISAGKPGNGKMKEPSSAPGVYRRSDSLSVDVASTALREMAQAKATDLTWSAPSGKGNRSIEKSNNGVVSKRGNPKDWVTVARKAKEEDLTDERGWDTRAWVTHNGHGGSSGPTLTPSATFPRRQDRGSEWSFNSSVENEQEVIKPFGSSLGLVPASTMPPAARAPGAKIAKPFLDDSSRANGWGSKCEHTQEGDNNWGEMFDKKSNGLPGLMSELSSEDQRVYDIWGNHFGEISRSSTRQIGSVNPGATEGALQSLAVLDAAPSFFSSFPQPNFPSTETPLLSPALSGVTSGFSVFSQAPDVGTFCLPSTLFNSPPSIPSRQSVFADVKVGNNFGHGRNGLRGHGLGGSLPGSPRKPRGPYSPPLGPSPMANEFTPLPMPDTTSDPSCSFWSGGTLQEVFTTAIQSRS